MSHVVPRRDGLAGELVAALVVVHAGVACHLDQLHMRKVASCSRRLATQLLIGLGFPALAQQAQGVVGSL